MKKILVTRKLLDLNEENDESDAEDYKMHAFMPTPAQLQAEEQGASGVSLKKKHKIQKALLVIPHKRPQVYLTQQM